VSLDSTWDGGDDAFSILPQEVLIVEYLVFDAFMVPQSFCEYAANISACLAGGGSTPQDLTDFC
jgi:hypothetical protein